MGTQSQEYLSSTGANFKEATTDHAEFIQNLSTFAKEVKAFKPRLGHAPFFLCICEEVGGKDLNLLLDGTGTSKPWAKEALTAMC